MKIYQEEDRAVIQNGPAIGVAVFMIIIFGLFFVAGISAILAYLGVITSENEPTLGMLIAGLMFTVVGSVLVYAGFHVLFHWTRYTFSNSRREVERLEKWLWGHDLKFFSYADASFETKRTRSDYRSGKADSLYLRSADDSRILLIEDEPVESIRQLTEELSAFTGLGADDESASAQVSPDAPNTFRFLLPRSVVEEESPRQALLWRLKYASVLAGFLGGFALIAGFAVTALLGRSILEDFFFYEILLAIAIIFLIGFGIAPSRLQSQTNTPDRTNRRSQ